MDHGVDRGSDRRMDHRTGSMDRRICLYIKQDIIFCGPVLRSIFRVLRSTLWGHPGPDPRSTTFTPHFTIYIYIYIYIYMRPLMCIHFGSSGLGVCEWCMCRDVQFVVQYCGANSVYAHIHVLWCVYGMTVLSTGVICLYVEGYIADKW